MFRYRLKNRDGSTVRKIDQLLDEENPFLSEFPIGDINANDPSSFSIIKDDVTFEYQKLEAKEAAKLVAKDAKKALKAIKDSTDLITLKAGCKDLAKVVHALVKVLDIVDPTEAE